MRSLEWAIDYPQLVGAICTIGSSAVATGDQIGAASIQIRAIKSDPNFNSGDYYEQNIGPIEGMGIARRIAHLTYRTESEMDVRFGRELQGDETGRYAVESYLDHQAQKLAKRFDANTYISLTEAMNSHDVGRDRGGVAAALATIKVPVHVVSIDTDRLFPPRLQQEIAELAADVATLHTISSPFGHDGFLIEVESVGQVIRNALNLQKISN
jgi:homoserine O-acetyltransferase